MLITRKSFLTDIVRTLEIPCTPEQLAAWERGDALIQRIIPSLTDEQREFIMTGVTSDEWEEAFKEKEDEND